MQIVFGEMIFNENPKRTIVQKITGIIEVADKHTAQYIINEVTDYDYIIPAIYDGEIIYDCPKLIHLD